MPTPGRRWLRYEVLPAAGLTLLAAVVRFLGLTRQSIWVDESITIAYAGIFKGMTLERFLVNLQGPFHALTLFLWSRLFGAHEFALRSLSALCATATVPLLIWALGPLRRRGTTLIAAALLAVSPFHLWYAQEIRNYAFVIFFVVLSMGAFLRLLRGERRWWPLYTAAGVLGLLSNLSFAFLLVTQAWILLTRRKEIGSSLWKGFALSWIATLLVLSPWMAQFWQRHVEVSGALALRPIAAGERIRGETTSPFLGIPYTYSAFSYGFSYGPSLREYHQMPMLGASRVLLRHWPALLWAALAFGAVSVLGAIRLWRGGPETRAWLWLAVLPVLLTYGTATRNLKVFNARYAAAAFPAYVLVLSEGILSPRGRAGRLALAAALLLPCGVSLAQYQSNPAYWKEDARGVSRYLRREIRPGDLLFLVGTDLPFREYYWRFPENRPPDLAMEDAWRWKGLPWEEQFRQFETEAQGYHRVLYLSLRPKDVDPQGEWMSYLAREHPGTPEVRFTGAEIRIFPGGGAGSPNPILGERR